MDVDFDHEWQIEIKAGYRGTLEEGPFCFSLCQKFPKGEGYEKWRRSKEKLGLLKVIMVPFRFPKVQF